MSKNKKKTVNEIPHRSTSSNLQSFTIPMSTTSNTLRRILVRTPDSKDFVFDERIVRLSKVLSDKLEEGVKRYVLDDYRVNGDTIEKIREWCCHHVEHPDEDKFDDTDEEDDDSEISKRRYGIQLINNRIRERMRFVWIPEWDRRWMQKMDQLMLISLVTGAHLLKIKRLVNIVSKTIANTMRGKSPNSIREMYNISNDLPEESQRKEVLVEDDDEIRCIGADYSRTQFALENQNHL